MYFRFLLSTLGDGWGLLKGVFALNSLNDNKHKCFRDLIYPRNFVRRDVQIPFGSDLSSASPVLFNNTIYKRVLGPTNVSRYTSIRPASSINYTDLLQTPGRQTPTFFNQLPYPSIGVLQTVRATWNRGTRTPSSVSSTPPFWIALH